MSWKRWIPTFLAFPPSGLIVVETIGPINSVGTAAAGGLVAGLVIGGAQWLALKPTGLSAIWIGATGAGMAVGSAIGNLATDSGFEGDDLVLFGAIAGIFVGAAQGAAMNRGAKIAGLWTATVCVAWAVGWLATWGIGVDVERQYINFGAAGAVSAMIITGLVLSRIYSTADESPADGAASA